MMHKLKICFLADATSIHTKNWCKHFANLGHEVHIISFTQNEIPGTTVHFMNGGNINVNGGNWRLILKYSSIKKLIRKIKPDILHAFYATSYGLIGALSSYKPYVVTPFGSDVLISAKRSKLYKFLLHFVFKRADWIFSMANHISKAIEDIGVDMKKVSINYAGLDSKMFNTNNRKTDTENFTITSTRNHETVYNLPHLLKSFALAVKQIPNAKLVIAGTGTLTEDLKKLANDLEIQGKVEFIGKKSQAEIIALLKSTHLYVTVSLSDGNSLSLSEAMACGALCLATDLEANKNWITNHDNGILVKVDDINGLAEAFVFASKNYNAFQERAIPKNTELIKTRADFDTNMASWENKYYELLLKKQVR
jgi:L-malate glycosyltransferase